MPTAQVIGVDLGGTAIKLARIRADGTVLAEAQCPTPAARRTWRRDDGPV